MECVNGVSKRTVPVNTSHLQQQLPFFCFKNKFVSEVRMSDGDQRLGPLFERFAAQLGDAVFSDDHIDIIFCRGHDRTGRQDWLDLADGVIFRSGREGDKAPPPSSDCRSRQSP